MNKIKTILMVVFWAFIPVVFSGCSSSPAVEPGSVVSPPGTTTTVIMVRHAERAKEPGDSALTPEGRQRAQALVSAIGAREITAIYSPNRGRNQETVQPLATQLG
ncbi:MAG: histidine phosphatase family protein, partial [Desulfobacterales bacterium]